MYVKGFIIVFPIKQKGGHCEFTDNFVFIKQKKLPNKIFLVDWAYPLPGLSGYYPLRGHLFMDFFPTKICRVNS